MNCLDATSSSPPLAFSPDSVLLPNIKFPEDNNASEHLSPRPRDETRVPPPGGILMVALLSGLSGAIMGLLFGGYLTAALTMLISVPLGIAIGVWTRSLKD